MPVSVPRLIGLRSSRSRLRPSCPFQFPPLKVLCQHVQILCLILVTSCLLTGCIQSEVSVRFDRQNQGEIVQTLQFKSGVPGFSPTATQAWFERIQQQSQPLGGTVKHLPEQSLQVKIPFYSSAELERKFNQFFDAVLTPLSSSEGDVAALPEIYSHLAVQHRNFLLVEHDRLRYELDLRSLGVRSADGSLLVSPSSWVDLQFKLYIPWGIQHIVQNNRPNDSPVNRPVNHPINPDISSDDLSNDKRSGTNISDDNGLGNDGLGDRANAKIQQHGQELIWTLTPGEQNQLEVRFWLPSPLGIGTVVIILLVFVGQWLKSRQLKFRQSKSE